MPSCYFLIGPPGCGKSTWVRDHAPDLNDPVVISSDDHMERLAKAAGRRYDEMFDLVAFSDVEKSLRVQFTRALLENRNIVVDRTNCTVADRQMFLKLTPRRYERVAVVFEYDVLELKSRVILRQKATGKYVPSGVIDKKIDDLVPPLPGEFDRLLSSSATTHP